MKSIKFELHLFNLLNFGGGFFFMISIAIIGRFLLSGGSPSAISIAVIPKDQISVLVVYELLAD
jgi:hypothetical protein